MKRAFARPAFRLLYIGMVASILGDSLMLITLAIWVKDLTGSNGAAGLTMFFLSAPFLLAPLTGWVVDRFPHRPFLIIANIANAVVLLPLAFVHGSDQVWLIYLVAVLLGVGSVVDGPALNGLLKLVLPDELLIEANAASQTARQGFRLIGPLLGAGIYIAGGGFAVALVDGASFLIAAGAIALIKLHQSSPEPAQHPWRQEVVAGFKFIVRENALRRGVIGLALGALAIGTIESVGFALVEEGLGKPTEFIAVIVTAMGVGGILGGLVAARFVGRMGELATSGIGLVLLALAYLVWMIPVVAVTLAAAVIAGFALPTIIVADQTLIQRRSPSALIGRVSSAADMFFSIPQTMSIAAGAALVSMVDYRWIALVTGTMMLIAGGYLFAGRRLSPAISAPVTSSEAVGV